ncbi:nucleoporin NSP1-like [Miscanthus floridulus]|uniref:nucleoporin NSP1-like n=1 Tax=Miscanthus floridulus TaxID=154761 RepID=UPI003457B503
MSITSFAWNAARRPNSVLAALPSGAFGFDGKDKPCGPPPGEIGSSPSLVSSTATGGGGATRVTSDATPAISTGIAANTDTATAALSTADPGSTTLKREGFAAATLLPPSLAATRYRVGLQISCTGVGATRNPSIPRPLTESAGKSPSEKAQTTERKTYREVSGTTLKVEPDVDGPAGRGPLPGSDPCPLTSDGSEVILTGSFPAYGSLRPPARDSPTGAAGGASSDCKSRAVWMPVCSSDRPDCSTAPTAGRASSGYEPGIGTGPISAQMPVRSSDRPARSATSTTGNDGTSAPLRGAMTVSASPPIHRRCPHLLRASSTQEPPHAA